MGSLARPVAMSAVGTLVLDAETDGRIESDGCAEGDSVMLPVSEIEAVTVSVPERDGVGVSELEMLADLVEVSEAVTV